MYGNLGTTWIFSPEFVVWVHVKWGWGAIEWGLSFEAEGLDEDENQHKSISIWDAKKVIFYNLKTYFIYFIISFYNSPHISVFIYTNNSLKYIKYTNK